MGNQSPQNRIQFGFDLTLAQKMPRSRLHRLKDQLLTELRGYY